MNNNASNQIGSIVGFFVFLVFMGGMLGQTGAISITAIILWTIIILSVIFLIGGLRVIDQYERGVILTLGKYTGTKDPGLNWIFIGIQRMIKVDLRVITIDIP